MRQRKLLWTGEMLIAGGGTASAELYTPKIPGIPTVWQSTGNMITARRSHEQNFFDDGSVLMNGGLDNADNPLASTELYDYTTGIFSSMGSMSNARWQHRSTVLWTGKVPITGGRPSGLSTVLNTAELYDPVAGNLLSDGNHAEVPPFTPRNDTGGRKGLDYRRHRREYEHGEYRLAHHAELYDPAAGAFTVTAGNMAREPGGITTRLA